MADTQIADTLVDTFCHPSFSFFPFQTISNITNLVIFIFLVFFSLSCPLKYFCSFSFFIFFPFLFFLFFPLLSVQIYFFGLKPLLHFQFFS